jgi:predicted dehydrogenase
MSGRQDKPMLKIAIVGCGKVADQHVEQIRYIPYCNIVGVCDREELMARQLQERLGIQTYATEVQALLAKTKPDVVHITTPPQSHYPVAKLCLEAGCHVYIEKPFTVTAAEAGELIAHARRKNLKLTVGHNYQFSHAAIRMRQLIESGYLGGSPVHVESYYCYDLGDASYAKAVLGDRHHWVRQLPGGLLQNIISHGISKIAEFLKSNSVEVLAYGFTSPLLRKIGETDIVDELRVIIHDGEVTAYFTFSSQMRPMLHQLRLYGPKNGLIIDDDQQTMIKVKGTPYKSYLEQFIPPWNYAKQYIADSLGNMREFLKGNFHMGYGMKVLMQTFYRSITYNTPLPIPYEEILLTSQIMDEIFSQLCSGQNATRICHSGKRLVEH